VDGAVRTYFLTNAAGGALVVGFYGRSTIDSQSIGPGETFFGTLFDAQPATLAKSREKGKKHPFEFLCFWFEFQAHILSSCLPMS
jgi:hypothetical protein